MSLDDNDDAAAAPMTRGLTCQAQAVHALLDPRPHVLGQVDVRVRLRYLHRDDHGHFRAHDAGGDCIVQPLRVAVLVRRPRRVPSEKSGIRRRRAEFKHEHQKNRDSHRLEHEVNELGRRRLLLGVRRGLLFFLLDELERFDRLDARDLLGRFVLSCRRLV